MPTISLDREYSTSKNIKLYLMAATTAANIHYDGDSHSLIPSNYADFSTYYSKDMKTGDVCVVGFNRVPNLQEIPDIAGKGEGERDTVEITTLEDEYHEYADGLKNHDNENNSLEFTFLYDGKCYNALREEIDKIKANLASGPVAGEGIGLNDSRYPLYHARPLYNVCAIELPDNSVFAYRINSVSTTLNGAGTNSALTYTLRVGVEDDIDYCLPANRHTMFSNAGLLDGVTADYAQFKYSSATSAAYTDWMKVV